MSVATQTKPLPKLMTFRLLAGQHSQAERNPDGSVVMDENTHPQIPKHRVYEAGEKIVSYHDLAKMFNVKGFKPKFRKIHQDDEDFELERLSDKDGLDDMPVEELREYAAANEVDVTNMKKRSDIINAIRRSK